MYIICIMYTYVSYIYIYIYIYIYMRDICAACGFPLIMIFWVCEMCKSNQITVPCIIQTPSNNTMYNACSATQHHVLNQELVSNTTAHSTYVQSAWRKAPYLIETVSFPLMAGRPVLWALNAPLSPENQKSLAAIPCSKSTTTNWPRLFATIFPRPPPEPVRELVSERYWIIQTLLGCCDLPTFRNISLNNNHHVYVRELQNVITYTPECFINWM